MSAKGKADFSSLANEQLFAIFKHLTFVEVVICERVCKRWHKAAVAYNSIHRTTLCLFSPDERIFTQNFCDEPAHQVRAEECAVVRKEGSFDMCNIVRKCPHLKCLHLRNNENVVIREIDIEILGMICNEIEHVSLADELSGIIVHGLTHHLINNLPKLRHLQMRFPASASTGEPIRLLTHSRLNHDRDRGHLDREQSGRAGDGLDGRTVGSAVGERAARLRERSYSG